MLRVSDNGRFLVRGDGEPFFYLGDTAWSLFQRLDREEADLYLRNRADKGFTVIQAVVLAEMNCLNTPNAYGDLPFIDKDINRPNEPYFAHVDYVVRRAHELGLYVGLLPTWGDKVGFGIWGDGPFNFINPDNAYSYGEFIGRRYADMPIIWILGGDRPADGNERTWNLMAAGLKAGDGGRHLMSYHPQGQQRSSSWFHNADWLDFNMLQSGHSLYRDNHRDIGNDYSRTPAKPCMDSEPGYENHPNHFNPANGYIGPFDVRYGAYRALFAGAHGHTYGCNEIWQFCKRGLPYKSFPLQDWRAGLDAPGSFQMQHARRLLESRPYLTRIPDQSLLLSIEGFSHSPRDYVSVTRDGTQFKNDATYIMVYLASNNHPVIDTSAIADSRLRLWWFDPRTGQTQAPQELENAGRLRLESLGYFINEDWVAVIDAAGADYPAPGSRGLFY